MLGERVYQVAGELGVDITKLAEILGFAKSAPAKWRSRAIDGSAPDHLSFRKVADFLQTSEDWLDGQPEAPRWSPAVLKAQDALREFARASGPVDPSETGKAARLVAVWQELKNLLPAFREEAWALYLHWAPDDWSKCVSGESPPSAVQLAGASFVTGIPERWFWDGDTNCLAPISDRDRRLLEEFMAAENVGATDLMRVYLQSKNPQR